MLIELNVSGLDRKNPIKFIKAIKQAFDARQEAKRIIEEKKPDVVIGTGGYVCWPVISAAQDLGVKTAIHESNVYPGLATRLLCKDCDLILLNRKECQKYIKTKGKTVVVGNPLRKEFNTYTRADARRSLGLCDDDLFILSFGGSIGAKKMNEVMIDVMNEYSLRDEKIYHIHASGERYFDEAKKRADIGSTNRVKITPYINDMPKMMRAADIVISRSGASTLSELEAVGAAAILVPSPNVTGNHQLKNALHLKNAGAAIVIEEKEMTKEKIIVEISSLKSDKNARKKQAKNISRFSTKNCEKRIYEAIKLLTNGK